MRALFKSDEYVQTIMEIDLDRLKKIGIKGILIDLDNTLIPYGGKQVPEKIKEVIDRIQKDGFRVCIISNATKRHVKTRISSLNIPFIYNARKPFKGGFIQAQKEIFHLPSPQIAIIGDQIFTDILGGNLMGFYTILVEPLNKKDFIGTKIFRMSEGFFGLRKKLGR